MDLRAKSRMDAHLARLELDKETAVKMAGQLSQVLDYIAKLNSADTTGVERCPIPAGCPTYSAGCPIGLARPQRSAPQRSRTGRRHFRVRAS